jgi:hypothetical protein
MAKQIINLGTTQDDGTGTTLRDGGDIINDNFTELYFKLGDGTTLSSDTFTLNTGSQTLTNKSIDSDNNTITNIVNADIKSGAAIDASKIANGTVSSTEFQYLNGVTSSIQNQINAIDVGIINAEVIYYSNSSFSSGSSYVTQFQDFRHPSGGRISGTYTKESASSTIVANIHYCCRETGGNLHTFAMWANGGNSTSLFQATHLDPYHQSQNQVNHTFVTRWTGLGSGSHTFYAAAGRGDNNNHTYVVNFNENSYDALGINTNGYSMIYIMEIE